MLFHTRTEPEGMSPPFKLNVTELTRFLQERDENKYKHFLFCPGEDEQGQMQGPAQIYEQKDEYFFEPFSWRTTRNSYLFLQAEGAFDAGAETGEWKFYNADKKLTEKTAYHQGRKNGLSQIFKDGRDLPSEKGEYKDDEKEGVWETYYSDGKLQSRKTFVGGVENGPYKFFQQDGETLIREGQYEKGKPVGNWFWYDEDGQTPLEIEGYSGDGESSVESYYPGSLKLKQIMQKKDGKAHGACQGYREDETLESEIDYVDGYGVAKFFAADGKTLEKKGKCKYNEDQKHVFYNSVNVYAADGKLKGFEAWPYGYLEKGGAKLLNASLIQMQFADSAYELFRIKPKRSIEDLNRAQLLEMHKRHSKYEFVA